LRIFNHKATKNTKTEPKGQNKPDYSGDSVLWSKRYVKEHARVRRTRAHIRTTHESALAPLVRAPKMFGAGEHNGPPREEFTLLVGKSLVRHYPYFTCRIS
jgi:hypothetical protein